MRELSTPDLLDALHALFEEDSVVEEEVGKARERVRTQIYQDLYHRGRKTATAADVSTSSQPDDTSSAEPVLQHKGYLPPSDFDPVAARPFGSLLDEPLH